MWRTAQKWRRATVFGLVALGTALLAVLTVSTTDVKSAGAQTIPPDFIRNVLQGLGGGGGAGAPSSLIPTQQAPVVQTFQPVGDQPVPPGSELERLYSARAGRDLQQVGYNALGSPATISIVQAGASQDSYVLGVGDQLQFDIRGQDEASYIASVDASGRITLPKLNPIMAAGRTLADFRNEIQAAVAKAFVSSRIYVNLTNVHQVSVLVTGQVRSPGMRTVSALASPLDAILLSGGIAKTGSLRSVRLVRNGTTRTIDLYSLIVKGSAVHLGMLQDGDRIFVPAIGPTVAIAGNVVRQGIYELPAGTSAISANELLALAGGTVIANSYDISKMMLDRDGTTRLIPVSRNTAVRSGEVIFVDPSRAVTADRVELHGALVLPGVRPLATVRTVDDLFHGVDELQPNAYTPFALIVRRDRASNTTALIPFSLIRALSHSAHIALQSDDKIYVFATPDLIALTGLVTKDADTPYIARLNEAALQANAAANGSSSSQGQGAALPPSIASMLAGASVPGTALPPGANPAVAAAAGAPTPSTLNLGGIEATALSDPRIAAALQGNSAVSNALAQAQSLINSDAGAAAATMPIETADNVADRIAKDMGVPRDMILHTVQDHLVWILDQVAMPGIYAATEGTTLPEMIRAAGGPLAQADLSNIEVTSTEYDRTAGVSRTTRNSFAANDAAFQTATVRPLDIIRLREIYADRTGETVTVAGQVRYPGVFDITRDERLSSVLQRAGGLTEVAYPYGAIFTRRSAAVAEQESQVRYAREIQSQLASLSTMSTPSGSAIPSSALTYLSNLAQQAQTQPALGRVTITADPVVLAAHPDLDMILEPGDALFVPKRPSSVTVSGEVLNAGTFQFRSVYAFDDYINMAGGPTQDADMSEAFVVLPDGSAQPTSDSWIAFNRGGHIPPGSTIVVPRDLRPFDWESILKDATQIFSQLAVAAASLSVITKNN